MATNYLYSIQDSFRAFEKPPTADRPTFHICNDCFAHFSFRFRYQTQRFCAVKSCSRFHCNDFSSATTRPSRWSGDVILRGTWKYFNSASHESLQAHSSPTDSRWRPINFSPEALSCKSGLESRATVLYLSSDLWWNLGIFFRKNHHKPIFRFDRTWVYQGWH